jgi:hypothetical protein
MVDGLRSFSRWMSRNGMIGGHAALSQVGEDFVSHRAVVADSRHSGLAFEVGPADSPELDRHQSALRENEEATAARVLGC